MRSVRSTLERGHAAETKALEFLRQKGMRLVERNYRCRAGELDLIMTDQDCLVFVEVRYRHDSGQIRPALTVNRRKQSRLIRAANHYLMTHPERSESPCRFDVIGMLADTVDWIPNAFDTDQ